MMHDPLLTTNHGQPCAESADAILHHLGLLRERRLPILESNASTHHMIPRITTFNLHLLSITMNTTSTKKSDAAPCADHLSPVLGKRSLTDEERERTETSRRAAQAKLAVKRRKGTSGFRPKATRGILCFFENKLWGRQVRDHRTGEARYALHSGITASDPDTVLFSVTNAGKFKTVVLTVVAQAPPPGSLARPLDLWTDHTDWMPLANDLRYFGREGRDAFRSEMNTQTEAVVFEVAGVSHKQSALRECAEAGVARGFIGSIVAEPENEHDPDAKKVVLNDRHVGYVPRDIVKGIAEGECGVLVLKEWKPTPGAPQYMLSVKGAKA